MRSGFSLVKNGDRLGYPYLESLASLAPLVDEIVVAHGDSDDTTGASLARLASSLPCPLRIIESPWNQANRQGGTELARQTNVALLHCRHEVCVYLQADELFHENEHTRIRADLERFESDDEVEALAFNWIHFFGNYQTMVQSKRWYRREIRAIKKSTGLQSVGDAQGFRKRVSEGRWIKAPAALSPAHVLHYGWVRPPAVMARKSEELDRLWHGSERDGTHTPQNVYPLQHGLRPYAGSHPASMATRMKELGEFDPFRGQSLRRDYDYWRLWMTDKIETLSGWRPGEFKNYSSLKRY